MFANDAARSLSLAAIAAALLIAGCASDRSAQQHASNSAGVQCPAGHTMTCEAHTTGRIFQGSFRKNLKRCACVPDNFDLPASPAIPSIHR